MRSADACWLAAAPNIERARATHAQGLYHVAIVPGAGGDCNSIGHSICVKADELHATLIAMAAHNKGRMMRFLVGSVTQYCVRTSHVTVAVL